MSQEPFDQTSKDQDETLAVVSAPRRGLRVPISEVPCRSVVDELSMSDSDQDLKTKDDRAAKGFDESPSGVLSWPETASQTGTSDRRDDTVPSFKTHRRSSAPPSSESARTSDPPEELSLDDAEVMQSGEYFFDPDAATLDDNVVHVPPPPPPKAQPIRKAVPARVTDPDWYKNFFGAYYLRTVRMPTPREVARQCDFIEMALRISPGSSILDVGCGLGLNAIELMSRGYKVVGLDISETMIARAKDEAADRGMSIRFDVGDIRTAELSADFDAVLCWGTSFGYFDELENDVFIQRCFDALKPGGVMLIEVANRDHLISLQPNQVWFEVDGSICMEESDFDYRNSRLRVRRKVVSDQGDQSDRECSIRLYSMHELAWMLEAHGFRVDQITGRSAALGVFFGANSPQLIIRAERGVALFLQDSLMPPQGSMPPPVKGASLSRQSSLPPPRPSRAPTQKMPQIHPLSDEWNEKTNPDNNDE